MGNIQIVIKESKFISEAKKHLISDCLLQLEGTYGLQQNGIFEDLGSLPNLKKGMAEYDTRLRLEDHFKEQEETGVSADKLVEDFAREYAFTWLNRFVAFKMMESRKIIKETVARGFASNAFVFYMADNSEDEALHRQGKVYEAYRNFIIYQCSQLAVEDEIRVLFDAEDIVSRLFPQEKTLKQVFELINQDKLKDIWVEDEVIGWVYQYFIEDEKERVFDNIYQHKKKMELRDIPFATQIFTPKWIVVFLVENTLGRLWLRMHPDSKIRGVLKYYVPNENDKDTIQIKPVREITMLDPACGTMHFGMTAFDLFYFMYEEEMLNAGREGWLSKPSVSKAEDIPSAIIENNIFGIDIDLRAIQLSALSLYLKAKHKNKNASIQQYNLVSTNIPTFKDSSINSFVGSISPRYELTKELLKKILPEFNKAYYLGSLLKIEDIAQKFLTEHKKEILERVGRKKQLSLFGDEAKSKEQLVLTTNIGWEELQEELYEMLEEFVSKTDGDRIGFIAKESKKGIGLINALVKKHDVVVTNPPYMGNRHQNPLVTDFLKEYYPGTERNLYTAFINRAIDLANSNDGFIGMITGQTFLFTSSFEKIRKRFIFDSSIYSLIHLDYGLFPGVRMDTCCFVIRNKPEKIKITCLRIIDGDGEAKLSAFESALNKYISNQKSDRVFILEQDKLNKIPSSPFVYWVSDRIRGLFEENKLLGDVANACQGIATANNSRFLRLWWEVGKNNIFFSCSSHTEAKHSDKRWFPYMKGGEVNRWYGNQEYVVNWYNDGCELYDFRPKAVIRNPDYYFLEGATYSFLTVSNLSVRYLPKGFIFDVAGSSIFPKGTSVYLLLGVLNSKISTFLIKLLNPTVNYQVGDIARLPYPDEGKYPELTAEIERDVKLCIELKQDSVKKDEVSWEFDSPTDWSDGIINLLEIDKELAVLETNISEAVYKLYGIDEEDIKHIEAEFGRLPAQLTKIDNLDVKDLDVIRSFYLDKHIPSDVVKQGDDVGDDDGGESEETEEETSGRRGKQSRYLSLEEICLASNFHPDTVFGYIKKNELERDSERYSLAVRYVSYGMGILMGRYSLEGIESDDDGITVLDEGHSDDTTDRIRDILCKLVGDVNADNIINTLGGDLRGFLTREFFSKHHIPMYKKRPVYWLLQTKRKSYGFYVYNLKFTQDTLYSLVDKYIEPRIQLENNNISELTAKKDTTEGRERRNIENNIYASMEFIEDVEQFKRDIQEIIDSGYAPHIDDGVILNMAPLYKLIPWSEPEKYYRELKKGRKGKYGWAELAKD